MSPSLFMLVLLSSPFIIPKITGISITITLALIPIFLVFALLLHDYNTQKQFRHIKTNKLIPNRGIISSLLDVVWRTDVFLRDIDVDLLHKYGEVYLCYKGVMPCIVVASASLAKQVSKQWVVFAKFDPKDLNMKYFSQWVGNNNIVLANGDDWRRINKYVHPSMSSTKIFLPIFRDKARLLLSAIDSQVGKNPSKGVRIMRWLRAVSLDTAGEALFGYHFKYLEEGGNKGIEAINYIIEQVFDPIRVVFPFLNEIPFLPSNKKLELSMNYIHELVLDMIMKAKSKNDASPKQNVLELLLSGKDSEALSNDELTNNIVTMIVASYETTQVSLCAVLYYLAKYPEWQDTLRKVANHIYEQHREDDYETWNTCYPLGNFILESLRCYSPLANQNARITTEDTELGGYFIKKGTLVNLNIHGVHMNASDLSDPARFDPTRFENEQLRESPDSFLPFGSGPRVCLGKHFTITEQKMVVAALLRRFEIGLTSKDQVIPALRGSFTGLPDPSFELVFTRRK